MSIHLKKGFTVFFAVLTASLALSIGLAIFDLTIRELDISQSATQSQYAIYAADSGAECALYWDFHYSGGGACDGSAFATSSTCMGATAGTISCNSMNIRDSAGAGAWSTVSTPAATANQATTTFTLRFDQAGQQSKPYCAKVTVAKWGNPSRTKIVSRGYNTCIPGPSLQVERSLQYNY